MGNDRTRIDKYLYLEQGDCLVPMTRLVTLATEMRSRIDLAVALLSTIIVSTVTCCMETKMSNQLSVLHAWLIVNIEYITEHEHLGIVTEANVFLQEISSSVILFIYINSHLLLA